VFSVFIHHQSTAVCQKHLIVCYNKVHGYLLQSHCYKSDQCTVQQLSDSASLCYPGDSRWSYKLDERDMKIGVLRPICRFISKTVQNTTIVTTEDEYIMRSI